MLEIVVLLPSSFPLDIKQVQLFHLFIRNHISEPLITNVAPIWTVTFPHIF